MLWDLLIGPIEWPRVLVGWRDTAGESALRGDIIVTTAPLLVSRSLLRNMGWEGTHRRWPNLQDLFNEAVDRLTWDPSPIEYQ